MMTALRPLPALTTSDLHRIERIALAGRPAPSNRPRGTGDNDDFTPHVGERSEA
jgi:hypothetical protein